VSSDEGFTAWATTADETIRYYKSNMEVGLTAAQFQENTKYGLNVFPAPPGKSSFDMITDRFKDWMVQVLLFAVVLGFVCVLRRGSGGADECIEPFVIILILVLNAVISVVQGWKCNELRDVVSSSE
jgi:Ca2+-transporting ATPase